MKKADTTKYLLIACLLAGLCAFTTMAQRQQAAPAHTNDILEVKFSPDATRLISYSAGDGWLILWDVKSGSLLWKTKTEFIQKADEYYALRCFAFSPDQSLIASGSGNGTVQLWDAKTGKFLWRSDAHPDSVTAVEFSPDGASLASAAAPEEGESEIKILRVEDGQTLKKLEGESCPIIAMNFDETGKILGAGDLDGSVSRWQLEPGKRIGPIPASPCRARGPYNWETSFTADLKIAAKRTGEKEVTLRDSQKNAVIKKLEAEDYRIYSGLSADGQKIVISGYGGFTFYDFAKGETRKIDEFSRTGSTIDLSRDGSLFAEGGSYGNAVIKLTETQNGKSRILDGRGQDIPAYHPGELESRLTKEKERRQALLREAKMRRDAQAESDLKKYKSLVYITFEHFGDMIDPGEHRILESDEPNKSKVKKSEKDARAVWLRLHNDSSFPIRIPTQSLYLPNPKCFYTYATDKKLFGLCEGREISIWHGLEDKKGKWIPYGFDFGSMAVLLPKTSALFDVPLAILENNNAIRFDFSFLKEDERNKIETYGEPITLRFRRSDIPAEK
jgi:hypothetical protein